MPGRDAAPGAPNAPGQPPQQTQPGALGSPINYDPNKTGIPLKDAKDGVNKDLTDKCGPSRCNITITQKTAPERPIDPQNRQCIVARWDYAQPLRRGGTLTALVSVPCDLTGAKSSTTKSSR